MKPCHSLKAIGPQVKRAAPRSIRSAKMSNLATHQKFIKNKLGVIKLAKTLGNVS
ncbi:hypothetical protein NEOC84_000213|nr:hypothetical protein [Neochlamydia sp. AcF84]